MLLCMQESEHHGVGIGRGKGEVEDGARRPAIAAHDSFELVLRADKKSQRYLFALNPHTRDTREDEITLNGNYWSGMDLGVGSGIPVPSTIQNNETRLRLRLHPGEGTVIALQRRND